MAKFFLGLVSGIVLSVLAAIIVVFVFIRIAASFGERPPEVADGSTLVFTLDGDVPEKSQPDLPLPLLQDQSPITVEQVWETFHKAAIDPRIKAIVFEPRGLSLGWAKMQEIHKEMLDFRKSGKPLVAFLHGASGREYYLATAADRIYMTPEDSLDLKGLRLEAMFFKGSLDKLAVRADVVHAGKYKDAGDMLTRTDMSPETQEVLNQVLDQYYSDLIGVIATGRKKSPPEVRATIDNGPFFGKTALDAGLVDVLGFNDQVVGDLEKRLGHGQLKTLSIKSYVRVPMSSIGNNANAKRIAFIVGEGDITRGGQQSEDVGVGITAAGFTKLLKQVQDDSSIKGAIIRIDSPGGDGVASDDILHAAKDLSHAKPVVISMSDLAASGGYFMSMTGDPIVAYPNTLTGSIGVIFAKFDLHGLYDKLGITKQPLQRGQYADLYSDYEPLTGKDLVRVQDEIETFYQSFLMRVSEGRKRPVDQIEPIAQGRVWTGTQAKQNGLVDQLGGIDTAIDLIRRRANIGDAEKISLVIYPPKRSFLDLLMSRTDENAAIESKLKPLIGDVPLRTLSQGGFLKLMPYTITVR
ncbi:MAG: signal peptide peptidase SppA [Bryobacteraceae bacterium]